MKGLYTFTLILLLGFSVQAQDYIGCDGERYYNNIFAEVDTTKAVLYGNGERFPSGTAQDLFFDVYEPVDDTQEERPVIVLAFGGSFIEGAREDIGFLADAYARKGYVAVSIDYRLFDGPLFPIPQEPEMRNVVLRAMGDMKGAIRHLRQDAAEDNTWGIDPDQIYVGGISAGSILALHVAAIDTTDNLDEGLLEILEENGGIEGNVNEIIDFNSEGIKGILNFSGGLNNADWYTSDDPPIYSVHDNADPVVPFGDGFATIFGIPVAPIQGSELIHAKADSFGITNHLNVIESDIHVSYFFVLDQTETIVNESADFIADLLCPDIASDVDETVLSSLTIFPNPVTEMINITSDEQITRLELFDVVGNKVWSQNHTYPIPVRNLTGGIYYLNAVSADGKSTSRKVIVQE